MTDSEVGIGAAVAFQEKKISPEADQIELSSATISINKGLLSIGETPYLDDINLYRPIMETIQRGIENHPEISDVPSLLALLQQSNSPELPLPFWYGQPLFPIVMRELLVNGVRAVRETPEGAGSVVVRNLFDKKTNEFSVSVSDTGNGIPPEIKESVFNEGFTTKIYGDNIGNGLFRSRQAIEQLGGTLQAFDNKTDLGKGKGATFTIKIGLPHS